jgi:uncharacterized Tic20 family protein
MDVSISALSFSAFLPMSDPLDSAIPVGSGPGTTVPPSSTPPPAAPTNPSPRTSITGSDKIWAVLCHVSGFIGVPFILPLVVYLAMRTESAYVAENAREALNFHISLLIYGLALTLLVFMFIGIPLLVFMGVAALILSIIAALKAGEGGCYRYPMTLRLVK